MRDAWLADEILTDHIRLEVTDCLKNALLLLVSRKLLTHFLHHEILPASKMSSPGTWYWHLTQDAVAKQQVLPWPEGLGNLVKLCRAG
jgi:hypothetical protein